MLALADRGDRVGDGLPKWVLVKRIEEHMEGDVMPMELGVTCGLVMVS